MFKTLASPSIQGNRISSWYDMSLLKFWLYLRQKYLYIRYTYRYSYNEMLNKKIYTFVDKIHFLIDR